MLTTYFAGIHKHTKKSHFSINYILQNCFGNEILLACIKTNYKEDKVFEVAVVMLLLQTISLQKLKPVMLQRLDDSASRETSESRIVHALHRYGLQQPFSLFPNSDRLFHLCRAAKNLYRSTGSLDVLSLNSPRQLHSQILVVLQQEFLYGWDVYWADDLSFHQESFGHLLNLSSQKAKTNQSGEDSPYESALGFNLGFKSSQLIGLPRRNLVNSSEHNEVSEPTQHQQTNKVHAPPRNNYVTLEELDLSDRRLYPDLVKVRSRKRPSSKSDTPLTKKKSRNRGNTDRDNFDKDYTPRQSVVMPAEQIKSTLTDLMADPAKSIFQVEPSEGMFQIDEIESIFQFQSYIESGDSYRIDFANFSNTSTEQRPSHQTGSLEVRSPEPLSPKSLISSEKTKPQTDGAAVRDPGDDEHIFFLGLGERDKQFLEKPLSVVKKVCSPKEMHLVYKCYAGQDGEWRNIKTALGVQFDQMGSETLAKALSSCQPVEGEELALVTSHESSSYCCINNNKALLVDLLTNLSSDKSSKHLKHAVTSHPEYNPLPEDPAPSPKPKLPTSQQSITVKTGQSLALKLNFYSHLILFGYEEETKLFRTEHSELLKRFDKLVMLLQTHDLGVLSVHVVQIIKTSPNRKHQEKLLSRELVSVAVLDKKLRMIIGNYSSW